MNLLSAKIGVFILLVVAPVLGLAMDDSGPQQMRVFIQYFKALDNERQKSVGSEIPIRDLRPNGRFHIADVAWCGNSGALITSGGTDTAVLLWDSQRGEMLRALERAAGTRAIACGNDAHFIASGNSVEDTKATVRVWDIRKSSVARDIVGPFSEYKGRNNSFAKYLAFSPDNTRLYVHYVNRKREQHLVAYAIPTWNMVSDVALQGRMTAKPLLSASGKLYAYGSGRRDIAVIDPVSGVEKLRIRPQKLVASVLAFGRNDMSILIGGRRLYDGAYQGMVEQVVEEYSLKDGRLLRTIVTGHRDQLSAIAFRQNPDILITASLDKTIELRNPANGALITTLGDKNNQIYSIVVRPDGKQLATAGGVVANLWSLQ